MSKLSQKQRDFLKTIENKKTRREQKQQFKLQNKFDSQIVFVDGIFKTDKPEIIAFFEQIPHIVKREENSLDKEKLNELTNPKSNLVLTGNVLVDSVNLGLESSKIIKEAYKEINRRKNIPKTSNSNTIDLPKNVNDIEVVSPIELSKKVNAQERNQELYNYLDNTFGVSATEDNLREIEDIVGDMIDNDSED